ncbi:DUF3618 domain-containing protein [Planotetraspora sp. A-T 1434]|uniref:DUF3618 domain-containing protein n=1 Tax=Planotetraspora sp. A-T 1434 TaxID=2979219 RepID=UPI0021BEB06D|nr:DUF3618 domain-containing protein [Planotetraspora sp. A-T 1434]MCT9929320.1 DUF3618 domain-containing protein [Planotetraspora sp. A-T 1434]
MTETDPGRDARTGAGGVGVHRQDVTDPVTETESLNAVPQRQATPAGSPDPAHPADSADELTEVRQDIARTREDLGDTIDALAAKADVKTRAQEKVEGTKIMAKEKAAEVVERVREATPDTVKDAADKVAERVRDVTPDTVKDAADKVAEQARRRPAVAIAAGAVALLVVRTLLRRKRSR